MCRNAARLSVIHTVIDGLVDAIPPDTESNQVNNLVALANEGVTVIREIECEERNTVPVVRLSAQDIVAKCGISVEHAREILEEVADRLGDVIVGNFFWDPLKIIVDEIQYEEASS